LKQASAHHQAANVHKKAPEAHKPLLTEADRALLEKLGASLNTMAGKLEHAEEVMFKRLSDGLHAAVADFTGQVDRTIDVPRHELPRYSSRKGSRRFSGSSRPFNPLPDVARKRPRARLLPFPCGTARTWEATSGPFDCWRWRGATESSG